mmetsp:Transcript_62553/g.183408  ORF Transcript_62553/g.183408 Transcript_62553/m.183408 type:complete len:225 (-) Transcript_62553:12-686(-)
MDLFDAGQAGADAISVLDGTHCFSAEETVIILDWDDTVLPSSWVQEQGLRVDADSQPTALQAEHLDELARLASGTITLAKQFGTVVLVTNAERGWIEMSCAKFLPSLAPMLESVKLLSARSEYERHNLTSPFEWKLRAFDNEIRRILGADPHRRRNVLSFGDSSHEREAVIHATVNMLNCRTKALKFLDRPGVQQLHRQHQLVAQCLHQLVHHDGNLDLCLRTT